MDVENFKRLFLPLHPKLFRIAYALVENKADAEDILQDAYYKLWSRRNELTDIQNPEAFCVTLVKNLCLDFLRSPRANRRAVRNRARKAFSSRNGNSGSPDCASRRTVLPTAGA